MIKSLQKRNQDQNREKKMALPSFIGKYLQSSIAKQSQD